MQKAVMVALPATPLAVVVAADWVRAGPYS
jgi:hypothetical protein